MAIVCLRVPHLALRIALLDQPELDGLPLLLSNPTHGRAVVLDANNEATHYGIRLGMTLREASALAPDAVVIEPNPALENRVGAEILTNLDTLSPLVEVDENEQGVWYIDLVGLDRHFPSPTEATRNILRCVPGILRPRAGVAESTFTANIASRVAKSADVYTVAVDREKEFLRRAPVTWLPIAPDITRQMYKIGLRTLGDIQAVPPARLAARFGLEGRRAWNLSNGMDKHLIQARTREDVVIEQLEMPAPAINRDMFLLGIKQLINRAFSNPILEGKQVRQITITAALENRRSVEHPVVLKAPCGQHALIRALELRLQAIELPGPVEAIAIHLSGIVSSLANQHMLPLFQPRHTKPVVEAIDQLKHRYGQNPIYKVVEVEPWSRIPERRYALMTFGP